MFLPFWLFRALFDAAGDAHKMQIDGERARDARLPNWRPRTQAEADQANEDDDSLAEAEEYEQSREWKKALAIYRELAKYSPVPDIVVKAKISIKRIKRAQGL